MKKGRKKDEKEPIRRVIDNENWYFKWAKKNSEKKSKLSNKQKSYEHLKYIYFSFLARNAKFFVSGQP